VDDGALELSKVRSFSLARPAESGDSLPEQYRAVRSLGSVHAYPPGVEIYTEGTIVDRVYGLESGEIGLFASDSSGKEILVGIRRPLWMLGAVCLFPSRPLPVSARTLSFCRLLPIGVPTFLDALRKSTTVSHWMLGLLSNELYEELSAHSLAVMHDLSKRLENFIYELTRTCSDSAGECKIQWPFGQKTVARSLGTSEAYLSTLLARLEGRGVIRRRDGWVVVPDRSKLWHSRIG
jgi:CRP-like cAMP-binding protein